MACLWAGKLEELWEAGGGCLISSKGYKDLNQVLNPVFLTNWFKILMPGSYSQRFWDNPWASGFFLISPKDSDGQPWWVISRSRIDSDGLFVRLRRNESEDGSLEEVCGPLQDLEAFLCTWSRAGEWKGERWEGGQGTGLWGPHENVHIVHTRARGRHWRQEVAYWGPSISIMEKTMKKSVQEASRNLKRLVVVWRFFSHYVKRHRCFSFFIWWRSGI